jgi:hypothetical protein
VTFQTSDWRYRLRTGCFHAKQIAAGAALFWLIYILASELRLG